MAASDIPIRSNGDRVTASWFNSIRSYLVTTFGAAIGQTNSTVVNNSTTAITGFLFDAAEEISATVQYHIERVSDTDAQVVQSGTLNLRYDKTTWNLVDGPIHGEDADVTFSITQSNPLGQLFYTSSSYNASGYISRLDVKSTSFLL